MGLYHVYVRVSSYEQKTNTSPAEQERICRSIAQLKGASPFDIVVWRDLDVSGAIPVDKRPAGGDMFDRLEKGHTVIAANLARMFRSALDALQMAEKFRAMGVDLILYDMGADSVIHGTTAKAFFGMGAIFAELDRDRINERMRGGKLAKKAAGGHIGGKAPFGYRIEGTGRTARLVPDSEEGALVDFIKSLSGQMDAAAVARELNNRGYRSRGRLPFRALQVKRILQYDEARAT